MLASVVCASLPLDVACQIYVGSDASRGSIVLSNFRSDATPELIVADPNASAKPLNSSAVNRSRKYAIRDDLKPMIESVARETGISPDLIDAVISVESDYNPNAVSSRGAIGLMQLLPATARRFGTGNPFDAYSNIMAGAKYLKWLIDYFANDMDLVLAAYNAGEQAVIKAGRKVPNFPETIEYVRRVVAKL